MDVFQKFSNRVRGNYMISIEAKIGICSFHNQSLLSTTNRVCTKEPNGMARIANHRPGVQTPLAYHYVGFPDNAMCSCRQYRNLKDHSALHIPAECGQSSKYPLFRSLPILQTQTSAQFGSRPVLGLPLLQQTTE